MSSKLFWSKLADRSKPYCVYLIVYSGRDMPPFYVGRTSIWRMNRDYHGSPSSLEWKELWSKTVSENPRLFKRTVVQTFDTEAEAGAAEERLLWAVDAASSSMYVNKSNGGLYGIVRGPRSAETRRKISESNRGKVPHNKGKKTPEEVRKKQSISAMGRIAPTKGKSLSIEHKKKLSDSHKGMRASSGTREKMKRTKLKKKREWELFEKLYPLEYLETLRNLKRGKNNNVPEPFRSSIQL